MTCAGAFGYATAILEALAERAAVA